MSVAKDLESFHEHGTEDCYTSTQRLISATAICNFFSVNPF